MGFLSKVFGKKVKGPGYYIAKGLGIDKKDVGKLKWHETKNIALPIAAAAVGAYFGGPAGAMAAGGTTRAGMEGVERRKQVAKAEDKQAALQRKEVTRLAKLAYENKFTAGGRSLLSTRTGGGKATVG